MLALSSKYAMLSPFYLFPGAPFVAVWNQNAILELFFNFFWPAHDIDEAGCCCNKITRRHQEGAFQPLIIYCIYKIKQSFESDRLLTMWHAICSFNSYFSVINIHVVKCFEISIIRLIRVRLYRNHSLKKSGDYFHSEHNFPADYTSFQTVSKLHRN